MKKLTKKQRGFLKDYEATGNATESAARNYNVKNRNVANNIGAENLAKPSITALLEKDIEEAEVDRKWVMRGTRELAEQRKELNVALGAYKLVAQILKIIDGQSDLNRGALPTDNGVRAEETRRGIEAIASLIGAPGSRFAFYVESGDPGVRPHNGEATQGSNGVHPNMEQA